MSNRVWIPVKIRKGKEPRLEFAYIACCCDTCSVNDVQEKAKTGWKKLRAKGYRLWEFEITDYPVANKKAWECYVIMSGGTYRDMSTVSGSAKESIEFLGEDIEGPLC